MKWLNVHQSYKILILFNYSKKIHHLTNYRYVFILFFYFFFDFTIVHCFILQFAFRIFYFFKFDLSYFFRGKIKNSSFSTLDRNFRTVKRITLIIDENFSTTQLSHRFGFRLFNGFSMFQRIFFNHFAFRLTSHSQTRSDSESLSGNLKPNFHE